MILWFHCQRGVCLPQCRIMDHLGRHNDLGAGHTASGKNASLRKIKMDLFPAWKGCAAPPLLPLRVVVFPPPAWRSMLSLRASRLCCAVARIPSSRRTLQTPRLAAPCGSFGVTTLRAASGTTTAALRGPSPRLATRLPHRARHARRRSRYTAALLSRFDKLSKAREPPLFLFL